MYIFTHQVGKVFFYSSGVGEAFFFFSMQVPWILNGAPLIIYFTPLIYNSLMIANENRLAHLNILSSLINYYLYDNL